MEEAKAKWLIKKDFTFSKTPKYFSHIPNFNSTASDYSPKGSYKFREVYKDKWIVNKIDWRTIL